MTEHTTRQPTSTKAAEATSVLPLDHKGSETVMPETVNQKDSLKTASASWLLVARKGITLKLRNLI